MRAIILIRRMTILLLLSNLVFAGANITGTIKFEGKVPKMKKLGMTSDPVCVSKHSETPRNEWLLVGENGGVKNMLVYIEEGLGNQTFDTPSEAVLLDQKGCIYVPHVLGIQAGQPLTILNSDGTLHNIHVRPKLNREFNKSMPKFKKKMTVTFDKPEKAFPVKCDVHPWMGCWIQVFNHPYFTVTEKDGKFTIPGLNPGNYVIKTWHEKLDPQTATISIRADETKTINFTFKKPKKK